MNLWTTQCSCLRKQTICIQSGQTGIFFFLSRTCSTPMMTACLIPGCYQKSYIQFNSLNRLPTHLLGTEKIVNALYGFFPPGISYNSTGTDGLHWCIRNLNCKSNALLLTAMLAGSKRLVVALLASSFRSLGLSVQAHT